MGRIKFFLAIGLSLFLKLAQGRKIVVVSSPNTQYQLGTAKRHYNLIHKWYPIHQNFIPDYYYDFKNEAVSIPRPRPSREYVPRVVPLNSPQKFLDAKDLVFDDGNNTPLHDYYDYGHGQGHDYDEDDDDDEDEDKKAPVVTRKKYTLYEKFENIHDKIHGKILDKFLHIKTDKAPEPPKWALEYKQPEPEIELPPWHKIL